MCRWQRVTRCSRLRCAETLHNPRIVHDVAAHNGEDGADLLQTLVRYGEVIVAEDGEIRQLTGLDRSELILFTHEPAVVRCVQLQDFLPRDLLATIDGDLPGVQTRGRV